ncbi:MAG: SDR family NAD(P)-dependent oxidoreductase, partial [Actinobacteria bacterium]|nr:SDR family NAD(P)-dependent oxidoreductase [Actinomycetota bacterium]
MGSRVAVITGGAQGIGKQTARVLNDLGWSLVLLDLQAVDVSIYIDAISLVGDITSEEFVQSAVDTAMKRFGRVDALVNNAGISCISAALDTPADLYRKVIDVNLVAPFLLAKAFGKVMVDAGSGAVVNVASVAGMQG